METQNRVQPRDEAELRRRLEEAEETIRALRSGEVDALVVEGASEAVHTIEAAHRSYRLLVDQIPKGAASLTTHGTILHANHSLLELLDRPLEAVVGRSLRDLVIPACHERLDSLLQEARWSEVQGGLDFRRGDETLTLNVGLTSIEEGALGQCLVLTDRTEKWLYAELRRAEESLRLADRMKDEFLATLAHELRNPLAPIRNAVRILQLKQVQDEDLQLVQGVIERQVEVMSRLVDDLLDVSRLSRNELHLHRKKMEISAAIDSALETSLPLIEDHRHELTVAIPPEPLFVHADAVRLAQVFANLLNNAAKYTERGGHIGLTVERVGGEIVVRVRDDGIGIAPEMQASIFDMFVQADSARTRSQGGLGVGLSLAKRLIAMHGGSLEVQSPGLGQGSEFVVRMPVAPGDRGVDPANDATKSDPSDRRLRVLVADDDRDGTDALAALLRLNGYDALTAYDGVQAIGLAGEQRPDVVLLDIIMTPINGRDVCRRIREHPWGQAMIIIALSGGGQDEDRRLNGLAGFDHHLVKPADPEKLDALLRSVAAGSP